MALADGMVTQLVDADTIENVMLNCPEGHEPHPCMGVEVRPGEWWWNGSSLTAVVKPASTIAEVEASLIAEIKRKADGLKMAIGTALPSKSAEYPAKAAEVASWDAALGGGLVGTVAQTLTAISAWPAARRVATFPYALADAKAFGDTIDKAIARFRVGMTTSSTVPEIAAREAAACAAVRVAKTIAAKKAAAVAVNWPA
ncbi:hypothetical protein [Sphingomonas sp. Leaf231]|uniref:hypothetical protein n=1 Tax=Sphingomonas sp. Leaf231 TaxID=1736301 RepID=UPI00138F04FA|nr:hypothetical protein [Sphingomonas sp. Leaf231]